MLTVFLVTAHGVTNIHMSTSLYIPPWRHWTPKAGRSYVNNTVCQSFIYYTGYAGSYCNGILLSAHSDWEAHIVVRSYSQAFSLKRMELVNGF